MVEEAAFDLRLGIVSMPADEEKKSGDDDLRQALKILRDFSEALRGARPKQKETIKMRVVAGAETDE